MFPLNVYPDIPKVLVETEQHVLSSHFIGTFTGLHSPFLPILALFTALL